MNLLVDLTVIVGVKRQDDRDQKTPNWPILSNLGLCNACSGIGVIRLLRYMLSPAKAGLM
jgi:hypothetical protein